MRTACLLLALALLCGCSRGGPEAPALQASSPETPVETAEGDLERTATEAGNISLRGASDPETAEALAPWTTFVQANVGQIGLAKVRLEPHPTQGVQNRPTLVEFRHGTGRYGYLTPTGQSGTQYMPVYLTQPNLFEVKLFNSQTATGPLHPLNAYWNYDVSVVNREDADEPNDDDNGATYSDRTLRTDIFRAVGGTYHRSLFQQASTNRDLEDWHQYKLYGGRKYLFTVTNSNGTWGTWTFTLRVVNANGSAVITRVNQTASSFTFYATPGGTTAQNYWVQVVGTPTSRRGNSVYFAKYSLQAVEVATAGPQVHAVTPNSVVVGKTGEKVTWAAEASGGALSYSWNFGNGASTPVDNGQTCNNCAYVAASHSATVASPKMVLGPPGQYSGTLTVTNSLGESDPFPFQYTVSSWGGDRDIAVDVRMVQVNDATEPRKFGGLNSWSYLDVSNWFHTHVTPVFRGTGVELVVSSFDWINSSEYFRLDSATERDAFIDAHFPNNQPARLTVWVVDALAGGTGYAYDRQCDMKNDHRGAIVVGVGTLADDVNTVAHELGHVMSLPHIRTTTSPLTNANYNLMSYGTTSNDLCTCIGREGSLPGCAGTMLHTTTPMNQYDAMAKWVETNL